MKRLLRLLPSRRNRLASAIRAARRTRDQWRALGKGCEADYWQFKAEAILGPSIFY